MDLIAIGRVKTAFGVAGEVKIESFSGETDHWLSVERVWLLIRGEKREYRVTAARRHGADVVAKLEGIDTPEAAKGLTGVEIWAGRSDAAPLNEGEYYVADLVGCGLYHNGQQHGEVIGVWETGQCHMLEVLCKDGVTRHVPFMAPYIGTVDVSVRRIELLTEWILQ